MHTILRQYWRGATAGTAIGIVIVRCLFVIDFFAARDVGGYHSLFEALDKQTAKLVPAPNLQLSRQLLVGQLMWWGWLSQKGEFAARILLCSCLISIFSVGLRQSRSVMHRNAQQ